MFQVFNYNETANGKVNLSINRNLAGRPYCTTHIEAQSKYSAYCLLREIEMDFLEELLTELHACLEAIRIHYFDPMVVPYIANDRDWTMKYWDFLEMRRKQKSTHQHPKDYCLAMVKNIEYLIPLYHFNGQREKIKLLVADIYPVTRNIYELSKKIKHASNSNDPRFNRGKRPIHDNSGQHKVSTTHRNARRRMENALPTDERPSAGPI